MRKIKLISKLVGLIAVMAISAPQGNAQNFGISVPSTNYVPSAQTWSFVKYGGTPVDLYTGTARVNVPIYTYEDPDFTIPISVGFASDGFRPAQQTGIVGLNWFLSAGGVITREIRGKDDFDTYIYQGYRALGFLAGNKNPYLEDDLLNFRVGNAYQAFGNDYYYYVPGSTLSQRYETEADVYHFNVMGHSGTFHFDGNGNVKVYNTDGEHGTYRIRFGTTGNPAVTDHEVIILETGDGYTYYFGDSDAENNLLISNAHLYLEYQVGGGMEHANSNYFYYKEDVHIVSWMLQRIEAPNDRTVTYNYASTPVFNRTIKSRTYNDDPDYEYNFDKGNLIVTTQEDINGIIGIEQNHWVTNHGTGPFHASTFRRMNVIQTTYLTDITISGGMQIGFDYSLKDGIEIDPNTTSGSNPFARWVKKLNKLDKIYTTFEGDTIVRGELHYRAPSNLAKFRTILESVDVRGIGTYQMDYYENGSGIYPDLGSAATDFWGYYNGQDSVVFGYNLIPVTRTANCDEIIKEGHYKHPNSEYSIIGNLKRITYPTGGHTEFEYEGHNSTKGVFKIYNRLPDNTMTTPFPSTNTIFLSQLYDMQMSVGGVRIKKITDFDGMGGVSSRLYEYNVDNDISDGTLLSFPKYTVSSIIVNLYPAPSYMIESYIPDVIPMIEYEPTTFDKSHIEYRSVREVFADGSYAEYYYSNYMTNPDNYNSQKSLRTLLTDDGASSPYLEVGDNSYKQYINALRRLPNSNHHERGKLIKKLYYNANGQIVKKEEYDYARLNDNYTASITLGAQYYWSNKRYTGDFVMTNSTETDYLYDGSGRVDSLKTQTHLVYNEGGLVKEITTNLTDNTTRKKYLHYYGDHLSSLTLHYPLIKRVVNTILEDGDEYVTSTENMEYNTRNYKPINYYRRSIDTPMLKADYESIYNDPLQNDGYDQPITGQDGHPFDDKYDINYSYGDRGRLVETKDKYENPTTYIWGYGGMYVIAIIKNVSSRDLPSIINPGGIQIISLNEITPEIELALRAIPNAEVTTMKYIPFVGVSEITEPSGRKLTYTYTPTGKLEAITDQDGNTINEYQYSVEQ